MKKIILRNSFALGDAVLLTAAVRDLHKNYPNQFATDVRTSFPALWENNPFITPLDDKAPDVETVECKYPLINQSNTTPHHVIHGFVAFLNTHLGLKIEITAFKADIHFSSEEKSWDSQVHELVGHEIPFWIIAAGGKFDVTIKWWETKRWQKIVDYFRGKIQFVQIGAIEHHHPKLEGVIDLRGQTDIRQLIRLVYHSQGVVCPVTALMHLAAAVETKPTMPKNRPGVIIAGGREPMQWEAYPHHQFIHTNGALLCCDQGGCWKSRVKPLGDGDDRDRLENLCVDVVGNLPRCMDMIAAPEVIRRIEKYFDGGAINYLTSGQAQVAKRTISFGERAGWNRESMETNSFRRESERFITTIPPYPKDFSGRGIVICGGGETYFPCAWVCIHMLRTVGCKLPIQLWYLGREEFSENMLGLMRSIGVECVDAQEIQKKHPARMMHGWALKPYAILHSRFREVLLLDADNVPVANPEFLFRTPEYKCTGAIFWPDYGRLARSGSIWKACGVAYQNEPAFESGQIVVDKKRCWEPLKLALWYNGHSDFIYQHIHGDKDTFHMAFRKLKRPYSIPDTPIETLNGTMCQHDFNGRRIFQHRNLAKWTLRTGNLQVPGFFFEKECFKFLKKLRQKWDGKLRPIPDQKVIEDQEIERESKPFKMLVRVRKLRKNTKRIVFRGAINTYTGYGLHSCQIVSDFVNMGYDVKIRPASFDERFSAVPSAIRKRFTRDVLPDEWELILHPPNFEMTPGKKSVYFTMWESTRIPEQSVRILNRAEHVIVPCEWNASCFSANGVSSPVRIVPLGINTEVFKPVPINMSGPCVFGAAGRLAHGGTRKGINEVIDAFQKAFPKEKDVRLHIKGFQDCDISKVLDPRIQVVQEYFTERRLAEWFVGLTCFVSAAKSEGWGLMQQQALAVGRPLISIRYGGVAEFFNETMGYPLNYRVVPSQHYYAGCGHWAQPDEGHMVEMMRRVYKNRKEARDLGITGAKSVSRFSWSNSNRALLKILQEIGMIS